MSFQIFDEHAVRAEVLDMLLALKDADYAISTLSKDQIQEWADFCSIPVKLRKLKDGKVKVWREKTDL